MGKRSREKALGLDFEGRIKRSIEQKENRKKHEAEFNARVAKALVPALLTTPFQPLISPEQVDKRMNMRKIHGK